jgi:Stage II sporulation protein E (SpoIIE)
VLGALRAAHRAGAGLQEAASLADEAILSLDMELYLTAVPGSWDPTEYRLRSINYGHPTPLIVRANGRVDELDGERTYPLGMRFSQRRFPVLSAVVGPGDRLLLYSDGVSERRTADGGRVGEHGLRAILTELGPRSAATTVRGLQDVVINASPDPLRDDAMLVSLHTSDDPTDHAPSRGATPLAARCPWVSFVRGGCVVAGASEASWRGVPGLRAPAGRFPPRIVAVRCCWRRSLARRLVQTRGERR